MPNFGLVIERAYQDILGRPADPGGREYYDSQMNRLVSPMTEAQLREILMRSEEYALKNPSSGAPPPPPPAGSVAPLVVVEGNRFGAAGRRLELFGFALCCSSDTIPGYDEAVSRGWPSVVDVQTLDLLKSNRVNLVHTRLGPFNSRGEKPQHVAYVERADGVVDLNAFNPDFWRNLRAFLQAALDRGIYVQLDLVDYWVRQHGGEGDIDPWLAQCNVQGEDVGGTDIFSSPPGRRHEEWIRKCVRETKDFPNVIYQDSNELWKHGDASRPWVEAVARIVRETGRLFGSCSGRAWAGVDYVTFHQDRAHEAIDVPCMVNEYPTRPPFVVLAQIAVARDNGTVFLYWPGGHTWPEREDVLAEIKKIAEGGGAMPNECPFLVKMGAKVHNVMDGGFHQIESKIPVAGGFVVFDCTPRFSHNRDDQRGQPCNNEHNVTCGGRQCEDPRGAVWSLVQGSAGMHVQEHGFQLRLGPLGTGSYTVRCEPVPDYRDGEEGKPVRVGPNPAKEVTITVGQPTGVEEADDERV